MSNVGRIPWNKGKTGVYSQQSLQKMSDAKKGKPSGRKGQPVSEVTKRKLSDNANTNPNYGFKNKSHTAESIQKISAAKLGNTDGFRNGNVPWIKGKHHTVQAKAKITAALLGDNNPSKREDVKQKIRLSKIGDANPMKSEESRKKISGDKHYNWKGGERVAGLRHTYKRRARGTILITDKNPYDEPIEYHHIHPDLPYVVPCPTRVHQMFGENDHTRERHFNNVNAMLGIIRIDI